MKKKHWIWIAVFVVLCILMPFLIEWLYRIGDSFPLIHTIYSASDVLGYVSGVIGLVISMVAIFLSLRAEEHDLGIRHAITVGKNNKEAIEIQIINNSTFDCNIDSVELCNKRQRIYCHIISSPPFTVKAKGHTDFTVEAERIERLFQSMGMRQNRRKAKYCIRLSLNKSVISAQRNWSGIWNPQKRLPDALGKAYCLGDRIFSAAGMPLYGLPLQVRWHIIKKEGGWQ